MDRRQRRTRKALFDAFEQLAREQRYADITVSQIIACADIGRSTFYAHFSTKDELLDALCAELFAQVFEVTDAQDDPGLEGLLSCLLRNLRDSRHGLCAKLLAEGEPQVSASFCALLSSLLAPRMPERSSWVPRDLMRAWLVSAFCQTVGWWHGQDFETPPERLAHWYVRTFGWPTKPPTRK